MRITPALTVGLWAMSFFSSAASGQDLPTGPREFARALAAEGIPAGFVVPEAEFRRHSEGSTKQGAPAAVAGPRSTLESRVTAFNSARGPFRAAETRGVVHIRAADEPADVREALMAESDAADSGEQPALKAGYRHAVRAIRGVEPEGFFGSGPDPSCRLDRPVHLQSGRMTTIEVLDEIVRQVPGVTWLVTYDSERGFLTVGLMCPDGSFRRTWINRFR